jgi:hypothetical protein
VTARHAMFAGLLAALVILPQFVPPYFMHLLIQILLWDGLALCRLATAPLWVSVPMCRHCYGIISD